MELIMPQEGRLACKVAQIFPTGYFLGGSLTLGKEG